VVVLLHWLNPVTPAVEAIRDPLFYGVLPGWDALYVVVAALVALAAGAFVFTRVDDQIAIEV
jgi:ABC-type polysaccharide/polyol phosphate export permease